MAVQANRGKTQEVLSSLPLQILFYLNGWYYVAFWVCEALIFIYKGNILPYPSANIISEWILLFLMGALEAIRLFLGKKGNLTERTISLLLSVVLSLAMIFCHIYLLIWQTYVLRAEVILNSIQLTFLGLELIFCHHCYHQPLPGNVESFHPYRCKIMVQL
ncbi:transmembrane protein 216-like isoform X1 [Ptychodera flava]|uniref:transmembrane protein 216-like isoform X1 n=1 Tax=Ptychodera flava TaxID=63121 RepID=UPI003969FB36